MELWRELLVSGLENENYRFDSVNDKKLIEIIESQCYKVLLQIIRTLDDANLTDQDCFNKIEEIMKVLEENKILCDRHDFG